MRFSVPLLARYGEDAAQTPPGTPLTVGSDGLLRRDNASVPLVEELFRSPAMGFTTALSSTVTKADLDAPDPNLLRRRDDVYVAGLETLVTRAQFDPNDPDLERSNMTWATVTSFTNGGRDRPDPDTIRRN